MARRYTLDLPAYWKGGRDWLEWLSESGNAVFPHELRTYLPLGSQDDGPPRILDFSMPCAGPAERRAEGHPLALRDAGGLVLSAGFALAAAFIFWLALNDLFSSRPRQRGAPRPALSGLQSTILYGVPSLLFLGLLYEGLRRNRPRRLVLQLQDSGQHGEPVSDSFRAALVLGELHVSVPAPRRDVGDDNALDRNFRTVLAMRQHRELEHAELAESWKAVVLYQVSLGAVLTALLAKLLWLSVPRDVSTLGYVIGFWSVSLWCLVGLWLGLERLGRRSTLEQLQAAARKARSTLLARGLPVDSSPALESIDAAFAAADFGRLEHLAIEAHDPSQQQAGLAGCAELVFNTAAKRTTEEIDPDGLSEHAARAPEFVDPLPIELLPRVAFVNEQVGRLATSAHVPARRGAVMIVRRLDRLLADAPGTLAALLNDPDEQAKTMAGKTLASLGEVARDHLPRLLDMALSAGNQARSVSLKDLKRVAPDRAQLAERLTAELSSPEAVRCCRAAKFLAELGADSASAILPLARLLAEADTQAAQEAQAALSAIVTASVRARQNEEQIAATLASVLDDAHPARRRSAAGLLGQMGAAAMAVEPLARRTTDGYPCVRKAALEGLSRIDPAAGLAARAALPARIVESEQRMAGIRDSIKGYRTPDEVAEVRKRMAAREKQIRELHQEMHPKPAKSVGGALSWGASALITGAMNPAQAIIGGALSDWQQNRTNAQQHEERKAELKARLAELEQSQQQDQAHLKRVQEVGEQGYPIESPALMNRIEAFLDADTLQEVLALAQDVNDSHRSLAALLLGEEIAPLEERVPALEVLVRSDTSPAIRRRAANSLGRFGNDSDLAVEALLHAFQNDADILVRIAAVTALGSCTNAAQRVLPVLRSASGDEDEEIRGLISDAIQQLTGGKGT